MAAKYEGDDAAIGVTVKQNHTIHITRGAHGKAIFAAMDKENQDKILLKGNLEFYGKNNPVDFERLELEITQFRKTGYAIDKGDIRPGINAVSSLVVDRFDTITEQFEQFGIKDGLLFESFSENANVKTFKGELIFGGTKGITRFNPEAVTKSDYVPPVILTDFLLEGKPVPIRRATHDGRCVLEKSIWEASAVNLSYKDKFFPLDMQHLIFHHQGTIDTLTKRKGLTGTGSM